MKRSVTLIAVCLTTLLAVLVCSARSQSREASAPARWEYTIVSQAELSGIASLGDASGRARTLEELEALNNDMAHRMTDLGKQGWELVCLQSDRSYVFKRKIS
jgi:hypothetical protein